MIAKTFLAAAALLVAALAPSAAEAAAAARVTGDVNLRAGPSTSYPRILVVPEGARVTVHGCLQNRSWCDVEAFGERGWLSSRYISIFYQDRVYRTRPQVVVPGVTFGFGYWDRWYADRPFYRDRDRWWGRDGRDDDRRDYRRDWDRDGRRDRDRDWDRRERGDWDRRDGDRDRSDWTRRDFDAEAQRNRVEESLNCLPGQPCRLPFDR